MSKDIEPEIMEDAVEADGEGGIVMCSPEYRDALGGFAGLFDHTAPLREAARFAMAIGIRLDRRHKRSAWSKKGKARNIAHLNGQFDDGAKYDFALLFELLGIRDDDVPLNVQVSEYISGGMQWIVDNELPEGTNFTVMKNAFAELFGE